MPKMMSCNIAVTAKLTAANVEPEYIEAHIIHLVTAKYLVQFHFFKNFTPAVL